MKKYTNTNSKMVFTSMDSKSLARSVFDKSVKYRYDRFTIFFCGLICNHKILVFDSYGYIVNIWMQMSNS